MPYTYDYPRPVVTVDCVVFSGDPAGGGLEVVLIRRGKEPFQGQWALPGGHVEKDEDLDVSARRELAEETGIEDADLEQLRAFGKPNRDPRGHYVTVAYVGRVDRRGHELRATEDASEARWFPVSRLPALAFDHQEIIEAALARVCGVFAEDDKTHLVV